MGDLPEAAVEAGAQGFRKTRPGTRWWVNAYERELARAVLSAASERVECPLRDLPHVFNNSHAPGQTCALCGGSGSLFVLKRGAV